MKSKYLTSALSYKNIVAIKNKLMKKVITVLMILNIVASVSAQTVIKMEKLNGIYVMPCKVNGLDLKFIFDTGASNVSISLTEALFMLKNGYMSESDLMGTEYYQIANGNIEEGTEIILKTIEIGKLKLFNVKASIVHKLSSPLLLGQSALSKLGKIEFDYAENTLTVNNGQSDYVSGNTGSYSSKVSGDGYYKFETTFNNPAFNVPLRSEPNINSRELYQCPKWATVYVIDDSGEIFYKVSVDGRIGYLSKGFLKK